MTPGSTRSIDPHRVRDDHDQHRRPGGITELSPTRAADPYVFLLHDGFSKDLGPGQVVELDALESAFIHFRRVRSTRRLGPPTPSVRTSKGCKPGCERFTAGPAGDGAMSPRRHTEKAEVSDEAHPAPAEGCRAEGAYRRRKKPHRGIGPARTMCLIGPDALVGDGLPVDTSVEGPQPELLIRVDEYTRERLAIVVDRSLDTVFIDSARRCRTPPGSSRSTASATSSATC